MSPSFSTAKSYDFESLDFSTLAALPGFIYVKSIASIYLWSNLNLSKAALGKDTVNALQGGTDLDFHWKIFGDKMRQNDRKVFEGGALHTTETSQRSNGGIHLLTTYKIPLYQHNRLMGLLGISFEHPINIFEKKLTPREQTCIALMAQGLQDKEIAAKLGISRRTVETYFNSSKEKLNVDSRAELIVLFCEKDHP